MTQHYFQPSSLITSQPIGDCFQFEIISRMDNRYTDLVAETVDWLEIGSKTFIEIIAAFDTVVTIVFEDGVYNWGRLTILELFASTIIDRARNVDRNRLITSFNNRIALERRNEYRSRSGIVNSSSVSLTQHLSMDIPPTTTTTFNDLLQTYTDWPASAQITAYELAANGFMYTGETDRVQCVYCRGILHTWIVGDVPAVEHRKYFPNCPSISLDDFSTCRICLSNERDTVILPCFHLVTCASCRAKVTSCPVCRSDITGSIKVFMS
jgi:hypothetical protein